MNCLLSFFIKYAFKKVTIVLKILQIDQDVTNNKIEINNETTSISKLDISSLTSSQILSSTRIFQVILKFHFEFNSQSIYS